MFCVVSVYVFYKLMHNSCDLICAHTGAVRLQTPLLLPRNRTLYEGCELACFMDHSGMLVTLPYDLRVSPTENEDLHRQEVNSVTVTRLIRS